MKKIVKNEIVLLDPYSNARCTILWQLPQPGSITPFTTTLWPHVAGRSVKISRG